MNKLKQISSLDIPQMHESRRRIYTVFGLSPTLCGIGMGGGTEPKVLIKNEEQNKSCNKFTD